MAQATRPLHTIGDLRDKGYAVSVSCSNQHCTRRGKGQWLDLEALIAERGAGLQISTLRTLVRCRGCGQPGGISIISDGRPVR